MPNFYNSASNATNRQIWISKNPENSYHFERIDLVWWGNFVFENRALAYYAAGIYAVTIYGLKIQMENRKPFNLRSTLIWWNALLGIFSIMGFIRTVIFLGDYVGTGLKGAYRSICVADYLDVQIPFWTWVHKFYSKLKHWDALRPKRIFVYRIAFGFSKFVELGDTLFIVLRKRPLSLGKFFWN